MAFLFVYIQTQGIWIRVPGQSAGTVNEILLSQ